MNSYVTTPIFYVNAEPHLGHAYTAIAADAYCRFMRLGGHETRLQTGTDEHGDKIAAAAAAAGVTPKAYTDRISSLFKEMARPLGIGFDRFIRTTDPDHRRVVQGALARLHAQGDIVLSDYTGLYCRGCERFLTDKELVDGLCPDHRTPPDPLSEQNYFFKMSRYQDWLIDHIRQHPEFITPERYRNEVLSFLSEPLEDLCISRPISRLTWGIPLPFDQNFVTYVWFDALLNYLTGLGYDPTGAFAGDLARFWPRAEHVVAKDILKPHAIYWPTMLRALGLAPYWRLHVHGYWNVNDTKMSKSIGNVVRPLELVADYGPDAVRYFLLREMSFGLDASFSLEALEARYNSDLANDLGNLVSRTLAMAQKFTAGMVPEAGGEESPLDRELIDATRRMGQEFALRMSEFQFHRALQAIWEVIGLVNRYIVANAPWELAKDQACRGRLALVIYNLLEALRHIALALRPVLPETARLMLAALGLGEAGANGVIGEWGGVLRPGSLVKLALPLFPRRERRPAEAKPAPAKECGQTAAAQPAVTARKTVPDADPGLVDFDYFKRLDLRVATVTAAERVDKSDRLLRLTVAAPEPRTVVAGIAGHYSPEEVVGRQVVIVANLKPAKLMGIESQGMVLAAKDGDRLVLSALAGAVASGVRVS